MIDPLAEMVMLLQPQASFSKVVSGAGHWRVHRTDHGQPFYCVVLEGSCQLDVVGQESIILQAGDFVLIPAAHDYTTSSLLPTTSAHLVTAPVALANGEFRLGTADIPHDVRLLIGHCAFDSADTDLLVSLLPQLIHIRGEKRLSTLVQLVVDESRATRPAREVILARLLEVLLIEALRSTQETNAPPGLLRGLADERLAVAIRKMHERPTQRWTVAQLAKEAALSRSTFFARFSQAVGVAPMEYLLAWRMALAKKLLRTSNAGIVDVAGLVGYSSASAFSVAFSRHIGLSPRQYVRQQQALSVLQ
ncbi:AraC family transcriptional regulator [Rahnella sp. SAP-1]|uniref:AraC family transcriptional regulator n=1 Tax=Rouxiella aceris TaxID=2703884 RepID=A0A848MI70_9GAMM|nr:AraC family transcriptional regulator [Rouxiella aceris]NMP28128.1 AraC family transcriptional regulator [Rouxiella aceris]